MSTRFDAFRTPSAVDNRDVTARGPLPDGRVLVAGGYIQEVRGAAGRPSAGVEIYDPSTGRFSPGGEMIVPASTVHATVLQDGRVLLTSSAGADIFQP
jgi:Kelch motif